MAEDKQSRGFRKMEMRKRRLKDGGTKGFNKVSSCGSLITLSLPMLALRTWLCLEWSTYPSQGPQLWLARFDTPVAAGANTCSRETLQ